MYLRTLGHAALEGSNLKRPKPLLLLGYLAFEGATPRPHLRELFWSTAAKPADSLRVALRQIREAAPGALHEEGELVGLALPSDVGELLESFRSEPHRILELYKGEFFNGLRLEKGDAALEHWLLQAREKLAAQVQSRLLALAEEEMAEQKVDVAAEYVRQIYAVARVGGLEAGELQRLRRLATATNHELVGVLERENRSDVALVEPLPPLEVPVRASLPRSSTSFIGREVELRELLTLLTEPGVRLLTIQGVGGIGKTRLALELSERQAFGSLVYVPLMDVTDPELLPQAVLQRFQVRVPGGVPPLEVVIRAIGKEPFVLVLDNYEYLLPSLDAITRLLDACPNLRIIVTSRQRLGHPQETVYPLTGLDLSDSPHSDAPRLFVSRARQANARFLVTPEVWPTVLEICKRLDASPLAIELAAAWVRALPVGQIAAELRESLELLDGDTGKRQSLRAIFEQSWQRLSGNERELLLQLSVFRGGFTRQSASAVCGATLRPLLVLVDTAFLSVTEGGRYFQHPLLAHFVGEKASTWNGQQKAQENFLTYFTAQALRAESDSQGSRQIEAAQWGRDEYENLAAAMELAERREDWDSAFSIATYQLGEWVNRGLAPQMLVRVRHLVRAAEESGRPVASLQVGRYLASHLSLFSGQWGELEASELLQLIDSAQVSGDTELEAQVRRLRSISLATTGQLALALEVAREALQVAQRVSRPDIKAQILVNLTSICLNLGNHEDDVATYLSEGLSLAAAHGLVLIQGSLLLLQAEEQMSSGQYVEARENLSRAEENFLALQRWKDLAFVYRIRGLCYFLSLRPSQAPQGHFDLAASDFVQAERLMAGYGVNKHMNLLLPQLGDTLLAKGELDAAEQFFRDHLRTAREEDITPLIMNDLLGLGRTLLALDRATEALGHLQESLSLSTNPPSWCLTLEVLAAAIARSGDRWSAAQLWGAAQAERDRVMAERFPVYAESYDEAVAMARETLHDFDAAFAEGLVWTREQATQAALNWKRV